MTVAELIELLQQIDDKDRKIMYSDNEYGEQEITEVFKVDNQPFHSFYILQ